LNKNNKDNLKLNQSSKNGDWQKGKRHKAVKAVVSMVVEAGLGQLVTKCITCT
jgi:hypothetical protein